MKHLRPYLRRYCPACILAPLFKMLEAFFDLLVPLIVARIIDVGIANGDRTYILLRFALLLAMALLGLLCSFTAQYFAARAAVGTAAGLRRELLTRIQGLSFRELDRLGASTLMTRLTADVNQVQNGLNMFLRLFLRSPFIVFGSMVMAFLLSPRAGWIFLGAILILFLIVFGVMWITQPMHRRTQSCLDQVTASTRENLSGVRVIRAFGREQREQEEFEQINEALTRSQRRAGWFSALMNPLTYVIVNIGIVLILWLGGRQVEGGLLLSGDVIALINYLSQILVELVKLANLVVLLGKAAAGMGRVGRILDEKSSMVWGDAREGTEGDEALSFRHVHFSYEGAGDEALTDVSFTLNRGQTLGIIGGTGSGKSTLVHLIPRFYDGTRGEIRVLGRPVSRWSREGLRKKVGMVLQEPRLFRGTVEENLRFGNPGASEKTLWAALETAQAADFVRDMGGLKAPVEQEGRNFSGGQRQRLTIARALAAEPEILILDDSTSALDYGTEAALRRALEKRPAHMSMVLVSQRTSALGRADRILVLEEGRVAGDGTHESLLETCPIYRQIHEMQNRQEGEA